MVRTRVVTLIRLPLVTRKMSNWSNVTEWQTSIEISRFIGFYLLPPVCLIGFFLNVVSVVVLKSKSFVGVPYSFMAVIATADAATLLVTSFIAYARYKLPISRLTYEGSCFFFSTAFFFPPWLNLQNRTVIRKNSQNFVKYFHREFFFKLEIYYVNSALYA